VRSGSEASVAREWSTLASASRRSSSKEESVPSSRPVPLRAKFEGVHFEILQLHSGIWVARLDPSGLVNDVISASEGLIGRDDGLLN
jgi:hypothetical protein